jgi:serine/threonine kinase 38
MWLTHPIFGAQLGDGTSDHSRLNELEAQLESMNLTEEEKRKERERHARKEKEYSRLQRHTMSVEDFEPLTIVGRGAFGEVRIVREKSSGKIYAMKKLKKSETVKKNQA